MPCDFTLPEGYTRAERKEEVKGALDRLEEALRRGEVKVKVGPTGGVAFVGRDGKPANAPVWERRGISDVCAYRKLLARGSSALRFATAKAEALAGRSVDREAVAAGVHSHDGGKTWGKD